jgi:PPOX class probable F420-dependent enzyme
MQIDDALAFARTTHNGVLATQRRDGRPQLSNITYLVGDDGVIRISITADRAKYVNLTRDSRASLHVTTADFGQWVAVDGDAAVAAVAAAPDDPTVEALVDLYRGAIGEHPDWDEYRAVMVRDRRTVVSITPTYAYGQLAG